MCCTVAVMSTVLSDEPFGYTRTARDDVLRWAWSTTRYAPTMDDPDPAEAVARLRALCLAQPNATERLSPGEPAWFVDDKRQFVTLADHHHDDRFAFWAAAPA